MSEAVYHRRSPRRAAPRSRAQTGNRLLMILAVALSFGITGYVVVITVVLPRLRISRVVVESDVEINRDQLLELAGLDGARYYHEVDPLVVAAQVGEHPVIRTAMAERVFPNTVRLELIRRRPLALALVERGGRSVPVVLDETGTVFDAGGHLADQDLPVLAGVEFQGRVVGSALPARLEPLLESLYELRLSAPEIYRLLSEVRVVPQDGGRYDLLLFTEGFPVPIRTGDRFDKDTCTYALMVLDVLARQGTASDVAEVDFRSGEIVYRMKEDVRGR